MAVQFHRSYDFYLSLLFQNAAKVGVGVMIEGSTLTPEEMGMPAEPGY